MYSDFTIPIKRLIRASSSKMAVRTSRVVKQLLNVLKLFRVTACCIYSFRIRSKETLRIMYPKCLVLDTIRRIHLRCRSFGSIIRFWILLKKRNIRLRIKNPDLDFNELKTHPNLFIFPHYTIHLQSCILYTTAKVSWYSKITRALW